jgi:Leucine-rich repeat (LRR) protein
MKKNYIYIVVFFAINITYSQIVDIPDPNFKNALVNTPCVIFGPPGDCGDVNVSVDINGDGEVQVIEAEAVDLLCIGFQDIESLEGIEAFVNLERLYVYNNNLTSIDVSNNQLLRILDCSSNNLSSINSNANLESLNVSYNDLLELYISGNTNLMYLGCKNNQLTSIDISNNANLTSLNIGYNELTEIDLSQHPNFKGLTIEYNNLTNIDVSQNPMLSYLDIKNNELNQIDISQNPLLEFLFVNNNNLNDIDVSQNPLLERLYLGGNNISSFDVSNNVLLETLSFSNSTLITGNIDLSNHSVLWSLKCENTSISGLNLKNGTSVLPNQLEAYNNPNLFCIDVDDPENIGNDWEVDEQVYLSEDCLLGLEEHLPEKLMLTPNPVKDSLTFSTNIEIHSVKIYNLQGKILYQKQQPSYTINLNGIEKGVLFIQFVTEQGKITKKIIKE